MAWSGLGTGTELDPYQVDTPARLDEVRDYLSAYFIQTADIDLIDYQAGEGWIPIGHNQYNIFSGSYNGQKHSISNLFVESSAYQFAGLFGRCSGYLSYIIICNGYVNNYRTHGFAGLLVGSNTGTIYRCGTSGTVVGTRGSGGLSGSANIIDQCFSIATVIGGSYRNFGGLTGGCGLCSNSYSKGVVKKLQPQYTEGIGGLYGRSDGGIFTNCYSATELIITVGNEWRLMGIGFLGTAVDTYFNTELAKTSTAGTTAGGTGRTTAQMVYPTNLEYANWDFDTVWINDKGNENDGYPVLRWTGDYERFLDYEIEELTSKKIRVRVGYSVIYGSLKIFTEGVESGDYQLKLLNNIKSTSNKSLDQNYQYDYTRQSPRIMYLGNLINEVGSGRNIMFLGHMITPTTTPNSNIMFLGHMITPTTTPNSNIMFLGDYLPVTPPTIEKVGETIVMT